MELKFSRSEFSFWHEHDNTAECRIDRKFSVGIGCQNIAVVWGAANNFIGFCCIKCNMGFAGFAQFLYHWGIITNAAAEIFFIRVSIPISFPALRTIDGFMPKQ